MSRISENQRPPTPAQQVNDLVWSLNSNPLWVSGPIDTRLWPTPLTEQQRAFFLQHFEQNSCRPKGYAFRLGIYFENLLKTYLANTPQLTDIKDHLQINSDQKTLGEFDFLYRFAGDNRFTHLEVCVKFYLGFPGENDGYRWVGLNRNDNLARKINRLESHQLRLGDHPKALEILRSHSISLGKRYAVMKGRLFYPWRDFLAQRSDPAACEGHLRGWWLPQAEFETLLRSSRFLAVEKQSWLGDIPPSTVHLMSASDTSEAFSASPQMLRRFEKQADGWAPVDWGVITPNHYSAR